MPNRVIKNKGQDSPLCDGSQKGSRPDTPVDLDRSNDSPKSRDAFSISNVLGSERLYPLSKQSNGNIRTESLNHGNKRPNPVQPRSTLLSNGGVIPNAQPSRHITFNHDGGRAHEELSIKANPTSGGTLTKGCKSSLHSHAENKKLSRAQVDILVDTVLRNRPKEVHQYRSSEKKELIVFYLARVAMGICKLKAEPSMLDMVLREKLDEITLVTTKRNVQREETRNGGNVGP
ncbi:hypothetical protein Cgig2_026650 [Carnegiea gigantea]|uniref:Uncharacterized protein n=1 Tax=Carnegiea gigantea TaxID=171969 RepID=A0A9Q1K487_9CARY|nr:hypothetical protein Cgig2_026650 [Carnegiea gigantea]